jgi:hypothetical protein
VIIFARFLHGVMVVNTRVNIRTIKSTDMAYSIGQMGGLLLLLLLFSDIQRQLAKWEVARERSVHRVVEAGKVRRMDRWEKS